MTRNLPFAYKTVLKQSLILTILFSTSSFAQQTVSWVASSLEQQWVKQSKVSFRKSNVKADVVINLNHTQQTTEGFGACFNELGWTSLSILSAKDRASILKELFQPNS